MFSEIASCEGDITFFCKRYDSDTRQWFFNDFDAWFRDPGDSRAYVLLGDPGVGKSVMAGVMAQRMRETGHLGAAYFCRHNDGTRNNPRYLLGTVALQLCDCNTQYKVIIRGESGVKMLLANSKLRVQELFTKLLQEPLSKCSPCDQSKLVIIDALDETEYESREDFLDLIKHRFPLLPEWLVFFITSRPEDSVQFTLKKYNPCVKICAGNCDQDNFYQQHVQDIQTFLKNKIDFSHLSVKVEEISKKCDGLFLYAHYIVDELRFSADSGKEFIQLSDLFPGDIDSFFLQNFKRVYDQVGQDIFKKLFGCTIVAPTARLPVSIISYILERESSNNDEQEVIDAVSQFVVLRTSDQTLTFLHNLIPAWLTDKNKARKLFIDKTIADEYLRNVFVEILSLVVNEPPTGPSIDGDLKDYVSRVAVRFLCENGAKDSLKVTFDSLTNYHFIERRMKYGKIEIYHLLDDFRLASSRFALEEVSKQEILQEILFAIESNVLVLLECPYLLHSCIRNASNVVQENVSIPQVSNPWLEWISNDVFPFAVDANITSMHCFATAPNERTVAGGKGPSLQFFDAATLERVRGPFDLGNDAIDGITHLEFTPDGKFLFFGRLDKWFSVERDCVEDFTQFSGNFQMYKWGVFTRDGQYIVVKTSSSNPRTCQNKFCLAHLLALWALKEIEQSRDDETTVSFCPQSCNQEEPCNKGGLQIQSLLERLRMREILAKGLEGGLEGDDDASGTQGYPCQYCHKVIELTRAKQKPSLENVRKLVIEFYPCIFDYQVWDRQSGLPLLQQVFLQNIQLNPFTYLCHCVYSGAGLKMKFSGIEKAMSLCNIAIVTAVCRFSVEFKSYLEEHWEPYLDREMRREMDREMEIFWMDEADLFLKLDLGERSELRKRIKPESRFGLHQRMKKQPESTEEHLKSYLHQLMEEHLKSYLHQPMEEQLKSILSRLMERKLKSHLHQRMEEHRKSILGQLMEEQWKSFVDKLMEEQSSVDKLMEELLKSHRYQPMEEYWESGIKQNTKLQGFVSPGLFRGVRDDAFKLLKFLLHRHRRLEEELKFILSQVMKEKLKSHLHQEMEEQLKSCLNQPMEEHRKSILGQLMERQLKSYLHQEMEKQLKSYVDKLMEKQRKSYMDKLMEEQLKSHLHQPMEEYWESGIKQNTKLQGFVSPELFRGVRDDAFKINLWRNIPKGFQKLLDCVNGEILTCMSPEMKWVIQADDSLQVSKLPTENQEEHHIHLETPVHTFSKFTRFTCSNDDHFFVHQSSGGSLQVLSFTTGNVLSSVSGCNVCYFTRERQVGYLFRCDTEETAIFLTNLFSPFKFLPASKSFLGKSVAAMFCSSNAVLSLSSDWMVTLIQSSIFADKGVITEDCIGCLTASSLQSLTVKNCALSSDARLIAIHHESQIELYSVTASKLKFLDSICVSTITCFAFSGDGTALLFCVEDSENDSYFQVWDIQEEGISARLKSRGNLTPECCCLSSDKVVLCGDYEIEIWEYAEDTCRVITRRSVEKRYKCVRFSSCTLSADNQCLVCCIADVILVYSLRTFNIYSSKQVFRGHLGIIEFCRFLKINRYLISYGVDGMVFLWDISQSKAVGFTRIAEGQESIVSMAVSPYEDRVVCFTSTGRVCMIKLCELGSALELKPVTAPVKVELQKTTETSLQPLDKADSWSGWDSEDCYYLEDLDESDLLFF